jgi:DDE family transposase
VTGQGRIGSFSEKTLANQVAAKVGEVDGEAGVGVVQALRIRRRRLNLATGRWTTVTVYAVTNLTATQVSPANLADWLRGHWAIETLHHVRDTTYAEDASRIRTGNAPSVMATLRNTAISLVRLTGITAIAKALRHNSRNPDRPLQLIGLT